MGPSIDFYFDLISPFSYLALQRLPAIAERAGCAIVWHPVELSELKRRAKNTAPPTREMPLKLRYAKSDQKRWAARYGVPIATPAFYDSTRLNRGALYAAARERALPYLRLAYHKVWGEGASMVDLDMLRALAAEFGWNAEDFLAYTVSSDADAALAAETDAAHARGVFGVPTMLIGDDMWWGNDRLEFLEEFLAQT